MAKPWRTNFERERDLVQIAAWYLKGKPQAWIAAEIIKVFYPDREKPMATSVIGRDIHTVIDRWRAASIHDIDDQRQIELEKINRLEEEYYEAWERSKSTKQSTVTERNEGTRATLKARVNKEDRDGNPAYLAGVQWCIDRRCKLIGLDMPIEQKNSGTVKLVVEYGSGRSPTNDSLT